MGGGGNQIVSSGFWSMGGYARFVWPCFAFAAVIFAWNWQSARRYRAAAILRARRALAMAAAEGSGTTAAAAGTAAAMTKTAADTAPGTTTAPGTIAPAARAAGEKA
jgi:heme exporter protein CcmD